MNYQVDISREYEKAKSKFLRLSLLFSSIFTLIIVGDILLIVLAGEEYLINLIISVAITILFAWFSIFFFTNIYGDVNGRYRYFKGYESGLKSTDEVIFLEMSDELSHVNGLYAYPLIVKFVTNLNETSKIVYLLDNNQELQKGDKLTITTYQRVIVSMEKHS